MPGPPRARAMLPAVEPGGALRQRDDNARSRTPPGGKPSGQASSGQAVSLPSISRNAIDARIGLLEAQELGPQLSLDEGAIIEEEEEEEEEESESESESQEEEDEETLARRKLQVGTAADIVADAVPLDSPCSSRPPSPAALEAMDGQTAFVELHSHTIRARFMDASNDTRSHFTQELQKEVMVLEGRKGDLEAHSEAQHNMIKARQSKVAVAKGREALKMAIGHRAMKAAASLNFGANLKAKMAEERADKKLREELRELGVEVPGSTAAFVERGLNGLRMRAKKAGANSLQMEKATMSPDAKEALIELIMILGKEAEAKQRLAEEKKKEILHTRMYAARARGREHRPDSASSASSSASSAVSSGAFSGCCHCQVAFQ